MITTKALFHSQCTILFAAMYDRFRILLVVSEPPVVSIRAWHHKGAALLYTCMHKVDKDFGLYLEQSTSKVIFPFLYEILNKEKDAQS